ncbi:hypothetical protein P8452_08821 [Trifolium repens]|nr:hypothetical protein P8452_08818 [Trifolium repens]WJX19089.1 hypothetical protein P8452_08821 [Trifolium repens]
MIPSSNFHHTSSILKNKKLSHCDLSICRFPLQFLDLHCNFSIYTAAAISICCFQLYCCCDLPIYTAAAICRFTLLLRFASISHCCCDLLFLSANRV